MQGHGSGYVTNPTYAIEQSGYPQKSGDVSTSGDLGNSFTGPTMYLGPIPSLHDCTSGEMIGSDVPWSRLSNALLPLRRELHPSGNFAIDNIPPPPEQTQTEVEQMHPWTPFHYTYPIPSQSNSTCYSTSNGYIASYPSFPMLNQNSSSWFPQEHLGYPIPVHPHHTRPVDLPGFHGFDTGSKMVLHTSDILDDHVAQVLGDHPSHTLSDHKTQPSCNYATNIPGDHTTGGEVGDHENFDESRYNPEQVVSPRPQLPLPPNQLPLSPRGLRSHVRVSRIEDGSLSSRFATARSRFPTRPPKAPPVRYHSASRPCGWRDDEGRECGVPVNCGNRTDHFAAAHGIKNKACHAKIICCWCPSEPQMAVKRKNFSRHMKEVHLGCPRFENGI
ncbi:hypothetical protein F5141DRAFT_1155951 [Pisolithus sp. B1]|nr:hypothetical protein F5141DRAFT_1155951 [Pisolithus sp. B1]